MHNGLHAFIVIDWKIGSLNVNKTRNKTVIVLGVVEIIIRKQFRTIAAIFLFILLQMEDAF